MVKGYNFVASQMLRLSEYPFSDHCIFIISQLWLTSHPRSTVVLLDTGTPGTSREIYNEECKLKISLLVPGVPVFSRTTVLLS